LVWAEVYQKNAAVAASLTSWALPGMMAKGWGRVVTISSIHGMEAGGRPWFMAAKAAQIAMMKSYSRDPRFVRCGITFNTVCPGHIEVAGKPVWTPDTPMGRFGTCEEVAAVVSFLCSSEATFVNGACITVDGGESHSY
jgi:NAD(P)-dependent dehydrogenase (short-subunit alcohol dehydrogenase family)